MFGSKKFSARIGRIERSLSQVDAATIDNGNRIVDLESNKADMTFVEELAKRIVDLEEQIVRLRPQVSEITKPHLEIVSNTITDEGEIALELEWNDSFINLLRQHGFKGGSEEDMVNMYIDRLVRQIGIRKDQLPNGIYSVEEERESMKNEGKDK